MCLYGYIAIRLCVYNVHPCGGVLLSAWLLDSRRGGCCLTQVMFVRGGDGALARTRVVAPGCAGDGAVVCWEVPSTPGVPGATVVNSPGEATAVGGLRATVPVSAGSDGNRINNDTMNTVAARQAGLGSDAVGAVESEGRGGVVPTVGSRATINDGTNHADSVSQRRETSGGGMTVSPPSGGHARDKETPYQSASQLNNAAHCSSCGVAASGAGAPTTRVPDEDAYTLTRRGDTGTTRLGYASAASVHGDAVVAPGGEKVGMFTHKHTQREKSFASEGGVDAELGFIGARPHECHADVLPNTGADATVSGERHNSGTCATGVAGAVWEQSPTPAPNHTAPDNHGGGVTSGDDDPISASYGVPDSGFTPIVYVDYGHQEQDWFEVYGPDYTDDEGELLPEVAAAARHSIPAGGGVVPVSPGSFLQVIDVVKWWLGVDGNMSAAALGTLRRSMKGSSR